MTTFYEIILQSKDFTFSGRDEIEDPLHEALEVAGLGEVTGGGTGMGKSNIDVEVNDAETGVTPEASGHGSSGTLAEENALVGYPM